MSADYLHLRPDQIPPQLALGAFRAMIVVEDDVSELWRERIAEWLVESGCLYAICWGLDCEEWHDSVDRANSKTFDYRDIPDEGFVMTTWHPNEPLGEAFWFAGHCAEHASLDLETTIIVHVSDRPKPKKMLQAFAYSQVSDG